MIMKHFLYIAVFVLVACGQMDRKPETSKKKTGPLEVVAVNYPLQYFAERIGGEQVKVTLPVPEDEDPADWRPMGAPAREFIAKTQEADLILLNGAGYAKWIKYGSWRETQLVHTSLAIKDSLLEIGKEHQAAHKHGKDGKEHSHAAMAYTLWLNPQLAVRQAKAIQDAFAREKPDQKEMFAANYEKLEADLLSLGKDMPKSETPLLASHPVYQYLERRFGLKLKSVHWEPEIAPPAEEWEVLKATLQKYPATWMIWEGDPLPETARQLREMGVEPILFDPCGNVPTEGDYLTVMRASFINLQKALGRKNRTP